MKNSSYYIAPVGDRTHDLPHTVASNMVKVSHALNHSATEAVKLTSDEKRGALCRKEGDGNESTRGEGREEDLREDGWTK